MRLIDADALSKKWQEVLDEKADEKGTVAYITFELFIDRLKEEPTIEAEPVKRAEWIEDGYRGLPCVCSYCGEEAHYTSTFKETFGYDWEENLKPTGFEEIREYIKTDYCPNCGADMREKEENNGEKDT